METIAYKEKGLRYRTALVTQHADTLECRICHVEKPTSQFYRKAAPGKWGYHVCRDCTHQAYLDAKDVAHALLEEHDKRQIKCRMCHAEKGLEEYYPSAIASHLQDFPVVCKACSKGVARRSAADRRAKARQMINLGFTLKDLLGE